MWQMLRRIVAFVVAAAVMVVLGSAAHSFFVQLAWSTAAGLSGAVPPVGIPLADRVSWAVHDLFGMLRGYAALTSVTLLIAFLAAGALTRLSGHRVVVFGLAGAVAILVLFTALRMFLGTVGIFGARGPVGLAAQMAVGLLAGIVFAKLSAPAKQQR
jgi:aldose sugar dehydrogenase